MTSVDLRGRTALVTGGTRGLGRAIGLELGRRGAEVALTHRWGSADEDALRAAFAAAGAPRPRVYEADAGSAEDTAALLDALAEDWRGVDLFVSNVCVALPCEPLELRERDLLRTLDWSAWPITALTAAIERRFGRPPTRVIATSSDGPDRCYPGYLPVAFAKAALEALVAQIAARGVRAFVLRTRHVRSQSLDQMFPGPAGRLLERFADYGVSAEQAALAAVALASGLLDGLSGRALTVDRGAALLDHALHVAPLLVEGTA
jgi:enoyl-[acyl-carrier protein] reductase III